MTPRTSFPRKHLLQIVYVCVDICMNAHMQRFCLCICVYICGCMPMHIYVYMYLCKLSSTQILPYANFGATPDLALREGTLRKCSWNGLRFAVCSHAVSENHLWKSLWKLYMWRELSIAFRLPYGEKCDLVCHLSLCFVSINIFHKRFLETAREN